MRGLLTGLAERRLGRSWKLGSEKPWWSSTGRAPWVRAPCSASWLDACLRQLNERLGPRLEQAIILHTGEHAYIHDDWITILPLDRLWAG